MLADQKTAHAVIHNQQNLFNNLICNISTQEINLHIHFLTYLSQIDTLGPASLPSHHTAIALACVK